MLLNYSELSTKPKYTTMKNGIYLIAISFWAFYGLTSCQQSDSSKSDKVLIDSLQKQVDQLTKICKTNNDNKKMVADFYQALFGDKNVDVIDQCIDSLYIQHNPMLPDGREALKSAAKIWFKDAPKQKIDIQHLGSDGNYVYIHTRANFMGKTSSVIDIFRISNGKIVEHWDVIQQVPEKSANPHPMF
jgi:predicted SnoaL-like aldol condensation-catalyzing enzyme